MSSIAESVTRYQTAQQSYEKAVARTGASADGPWTGKSIGIAGRALAGARSAVQTARLIADAREKLGSELADELLEHACKAALFSAEAAEQAGELSIDLSSLDPLAGAGDRTRDVAAQISNAIKDTLQST